MRDDYYGRCDPYHDGERFSVVRNPYDFVVIDKRNGNRIYSRHHSSTAAHRHADALNEASAAEDRE